MDAVILAGRHEKYFDKPVSLIELTDGVTLLKRILSLLEEVGISKIFLVTGFKSELFASLSNVEIIYNDRYADTSSMASLALVEPVVTEDFLLIESDLLFEKTFLTRLLDTTGKNLLSIVSESGSGDEAFVELEDGFVKDISKDVHRLSRIDGEMIGLSKVSLPTFKRMLEKWKECNNPLINYEYLLLSCAKLHEIVAVKSTDLISYEIDTEVDFHHVKNTIYPILCRKENPFDESNVLAVFQQIMGLDSLSKESVQITQIGGMTNRNFKLTYDHHSYVLRIPGNGTEGMILRTNEDYNSKIACHLRITPELFYLNVDTGIKLVKYIEGAETLNCATIQRLDNLEKVISHLRLLHNSGIRFKNDFNVFNEIGIYEKLLQEAGGQMYEGYDELRPRVAALADCLNQMGVTLSPCHNDLVAENFVKSANGSIYLIDWEYSGMNDPLWDLAALFIESSFTEEKRQKALSLYYAGVIPPYTELKILIYQILMDLLWAIWTCIKEARGDHFGTYGIMRYQRAVQNLNLVNQQIDKS